MKLIFNKALEFYGFLSTYIGKKVEKEKDSDELNIPTEPRLEEIFNEVEHSISPFLKNDIELFFDKMFLTLWLFFYQIRHHLFTDELAFLDYMENMSNEDFRMLYLEHLKFGSDKPFDDQITQKEINEKLTTNFFKSSRTQAKMLKQLIDNPEDWKPRIVTTLKDFHKQHYLPYKNELLKEGKKRFQTTEKVFWKDPTHYLDTVTMGHYKNTLKHAPEATVFISYTLERGLMVSITQKIILLGLSREMLLTSANQKMQTNMLFRTLSDKKRVDILRLLGEREWFSNELAKHFGITAATMSYHLGKLLNSGFITLRLGDQNKAFYSLNKENLINYLECARADLVGDITCKTRDST